MKTYLDCLPCFVRQTLDAGRMAGLDETGLEHLVRQALHLLAGISFSESPPHMAARIHRLIRQSTDADDPYAHLKHEYNQKALIMLPELRRLTREATDPFETAVRLAIAGNVIDFGLRSVTEVISLEQAVEAALKAPLAVNDLGALRVCAERAEHILVVGDNAGEIVFDRVLIETIRNGRDTVFSVRGRPIINDVTLADACEVGMDQTARVISSGSEGPGVIIEECSPEFMQVFDRADLAIAKGQGNYETLSGSGKPGLFFLLKAKCPVIARHLGCEVGGMIVKREPTPALQAD